ncbi:MAG: hypothetical protein AAB797_03230 [Patescibacteria group bacterium]
MDVQELRKTYGQTKSVLVASLILASAINYFLFIVPIIKLLICNENIVNFISFAVPFVLVFYSNKTIYDYLFKRRMISLSGLIIFNGLLFACFKGYIFNFFTEKYGTKCKA